MCVRATIKDLQVWIDNPTPDANQIINGRTPHDRAKDLLKQAERRRREQQVARYNTAHGHDAELVKNLCEVLDELEDAVADLRKGLKRGTADPTEIMGTVAESMKGLRESREDVKAVEAMAVTAAEHIDKTPADYEQEMLDRFPSMPVAWATDRFLCGQEPSPFDEPQRTGD